MVETYVVFHHLVFECSHSKNEKKIDCSIIGPWVDRIVYSGNREPYVTPTHAQQTCRQIALFRRWSSGDNNSRKNKQRKKQVHSHDFANEHKDLTCELAGGIISIRSSALTSDMFNAGPAEKP